MQRHADPRIGLGEPRDRAPRQLLAEDRPVGGDPRLEHGDAARGHVERERLDHAVANGGAINSMSAATSASRASIARGGDRNPSWMPPAGQSLPVSSMTTYSAPLASRTS